MTSRGGMALGELLRGWSERALLTQEQLAQRARLGVRTIRRLETGGSHRPYAGSLRLVADALCLNDEELTLLRAAWTPTASGGPERPAGPTGPAPSVPRQLPPAVRDFVGRAAELARLTALADEVAGSDGMVQISAIDGTAGVGKTALALHWAHRAAGRFPDGQLYVNLRGFDPTAPTSPSEALHGFLHALGVDPDRIPAGLDARAGLYRSLLAGRRVLVVLDNARDADQARPLLPGSGASLVLVTSRNQLPGLAAAEGARLITLDLLTTDEAVQLLALRLGPERLDGQQGAVYELVARCARLPLALAIVAAQAEARPHIPLAALAVELGGGRSLEALDTGDRMTRMRTVLSWSYLGLGDGAARLFRLLGVHPGPDATVPAMASLMGLPASHILPMLEELTGGHLVSEHAPGRFTQHDLLRAYSIELARAHETGAGRHAALLRVLGHYLHTGHEATMRLDPHRHPIAMIELSPGVVPEQLADHEQALAWFTAEHAVVVAAVRLAESSRLDAHTWQLSWTLMTFLEWRGHWDDWVALGRAALDSARRLGDRSTEAGIHRILGRGHARLRRHDEALAHFQCALDLYQALEDRTGLAHTHVNISSAQEWRGRHRDAIDHARRAAEYYAATGDRHGEAATFNNIGWCHAQMRNYRRALVYCQRAVALHHEVGDPRGEANAWDSLGYAQHHLGRHDLAMVCYQNAIDLFHASGDRYQEADTLDHLGDARRAAGDVNCARDAWCRALDTLDQHGLPGADQVRAKLAALDGASPGR